MASLVAPQVSHWNASDTDTITVVPPPTWISGSLSTAASDIKGKDSKEAVKHVEPAVKHATSPTKGRSASSAKPSSMSEQVSLAKSGFESDGMARNRMNLHSTPGSKKVNNASPSPPYRSVKLS